MRTLLCLSGTGKRCKMLAQVIKSQKQFNAISAATCKEAIHIIQTHNIDSIMIDLEDRLPNLQTFLAIAEARLPHIYRFFIRGRHFSIKERDLLLKGHHSFAMPRNSVELDTILNKIRRDFPVQIVEKSKAEEKELTMIDRIDELLTTFSAIEPSQRYLSSRITGDHELARLLLNRINSPFYGLPSRIESVERAVRLLGVRGVLSLFEESIRRPVSQVA